MIELNEVLTDKFINLSSVASAMQPGKKSRIAANTVRKRAIENRVHPQAETERIRADLALLSKKIEIYLEKSMQKLV